MKCLKCNDSPICKAECDLYIGRLKEIQVAVDQFDHNAATEKIQKFEAFLHTKRDDITEM